jgi:hypothetical protein
MARKLIWGVALALIMIAGVSGFLFTFYRQDVATLQKFTAAYEKYDAAVADQSLSESSATLGPLKSAAEIRLSSAIKNDGRLMLAEHEIADISGQEVDRLGAYKTAVQNQAADGDALGGALREITAQRRAAYVHFQELLN